MQATKVLKAKAQQAGFTVLEILVVITIMGFLIAMVAPRLAGFSSGAIDNICDTNQNRMVGYMSQYFEKTSRYPTDLTNLINQDGVTFGLPAVSDGNPATGAEVFAKELQDRVQLTAHTLTTAEAEELVALGIAQVFNLNDYSGTTPTTPHASMDPVNLNAIPADFAVAMAGMGHDGTNWVVTGNERGLGEPDWFGRIVLGLGTESGLVKDGIIANAAHCPGGLQNADNATYNDYNIVLPRLEATAARMVDATGANITGAGDATGDVVAVAYDDNEPSTDYAVVGNSDNYRKRTFNIVEAQEAWQFATVCPEGHMYPEDDNEFWAVDVDNSGNIEVNP